MMTQPITASRPSPAAPLRRALGPLLLALSAAACDDGPTGPRGPDTMRLAALTVTDTALGAISRHDFHYDASGRLARVEFRISERRNGPPVWFTRYVEHAYEGSLPTVSNYYGLAVNGSFVNYQRITYTYDAQGRLASDLTEFATSGGVQSYTQTYGYDGRGRISRVDEQGGDRTTFAYTGSGSLQKAELRSGEGNVFHHTYRHEPGRNPFYGRPHLVNSLFVPLVLWPMLLSPDNMVRQENRVNSDPALISSVSHDFTYDEDGRPLRLRQMFINDIHPESRGTWIFFDFEYEPANDI